MTEAHLEENPQNITSAEMVVAIPSYREAKLIGYPTTQAAQGLKRYFGDKSCVIINCDNNSDDGTKEAFFEADTEDVPQIYISTPPGVRGKGNNFHNLFRKVVELGAEAVVVVDADLKSITPQWIRHLGEPLFNDFGYVAPLYVRHKYDGTITNAIAYPFTRALYGRRVRQPIGGDFGFSGELARIYLASPTWTEAVSQFGIDIWMTTLAMNNNVPICQAFMGRPKIHKPKDPGSDLGPMFSQVVGTIFDLMRHSAGYWMRVKWSKPTSIYGFGLGEVEMPPPVKVTQEKLAENFSLGMGTYREAWQEILTEPIFAKVEEVAGLPEDMFDFPTQTWAKLLFDYAVAYNKGVMDSQALLDSLIPLYFGKTLSYVRKTERMSVQQAEEYIETECMVFEETKPYLVDHWVA
ncbi:MAG: glycosyltransferase family 2 protein [Desulfarculaceae bacterium]|nr:glycosyltransferase family 2 protein [Desulfarculaceae bacterium]MCF8073950.1 glycosyltransferase family 2 protein [Desulfarculaceae bacterium]MCF8102636.1 glycosyltransferase family 2 protein [Desulfarculaceae bacterium]MCF8117595.1 glycosyltransferase family 2 protein [Desulfarculaceae bacterium]